jgi:hypothetical protein
MRSVHDNQLLSYLVDHEKKEIVIHTVFKDKGEPYEYTDIRFEGVVCYSFVNDTFGTIIYDFKETPVDQIVHENEQLFTDGIPYGWPGFKGESVQAIIMDMEKEKLASWVLNSSIGMTGFVIARSLIVEDHCNKQ